LGKEHEDSLLEYFVLENGIPFRDAMQRTLEMISPEYLQEFQRHFNEFMKSEICKIYSRKMTLNRINQPYIT